MAPHVPRNQAAAKRPAVRGTSAARKPGAAHAACPKLKRAAKKPVKRAKACTKPKTPKVTPKAPPVFLPANPAVSAALPLSPPVGPAPLAGSPAPPSDALTPPASGSPPPTPVLRSFGRADAERLLWRAGFGPRAGDVERLVALGLDGAVASLVRPVGAATLVGPPPHDADGRALAPEDLWGHDHCWWLDRMVRSDQPLVERMTLVWHDWFATSDDKVDNKRQMLDQNALLRRHALGSFAELLRDVTRDPAMLVGLDGIANTRSEPNENHARELMELFTLGAGRDAYTEGDVRELARTMTGWRADWVEGVGLTAFRYDDERHDPQTKTVFGRAGTWGYDDAARLCLEHPAHASFLVAKLWRTFVAEPLGPADAASLEAIYVGGGHQVAPVLEAILKHPALYAGGVLVKPPVVLAAGLLRALGRFVDTVDWTWLCAEAGQLLFRPPNVAGWDDSAWLDTSTWRARWYLAVYAIKDRQVDPWNAPYDQAETPETALQRALAFAGDPAITAEQREALLSFARSCLPAIMASWQLGPLRAERQNALRLLVLTAADHQVS